VRTLHHKWLPSIVCASLAATAGCMPPPRADIGHVDEGQMICAKGTTTKGVDVSHYDGTIDWAKAHGAGIDWAIMKATENVNFVDPKFATNWQNAGQNGVIRGAYHFFRPAVDAVKQADYFVQNAGMPGPNDLPPTIDLEVTDGLSGSQVAAGALAFLQEVQAKTGRVPIVYTSPSFFNSTLGGPSGFGGYTIWVANWQVSCPNVPSPPWNDWTFWQSSDSGTVAGIPSTVDLDEFNGSLSDLQSWINPQTTPHDLGGGSPDLGGTGPSGDGGGGSPDLGGTGPSGDGGGGSPDLAQSGGHTPNHATAPGGCSCEIGARRGGMSPLLMMLALLALAGILRRVT
jgi:GH25 family lysozyme M1 (1,4-beta-N-acetylmuramidase)